jgi:hypothetical protein
LTAADQESSIFWNSRISGLAAEVAVDCTETGVEPGLATELAADAETAFEAGV